MRHLDKPVIFPQQYYPGSDIVGYFLTSFEVSIMAEVPVFQGVEALGGVMIYSELEHGTF